MSIPDCEPESGDWGYSLGKVATGLGVATDNLHRWIDSKGLPAHDVGHPWKFKLYEVNAWVRSSNADASGETGKA
ncbi:MAG: helix-turn-helix domain-containing protein [Acidobacteria bacterium]|nr:helix-turn-helix domain-containing protein [Acidobacteriota bacterium]